MGNLQIKEDGTGIRKIDTKNIFQQQTIDKILKTPKREHPFTRQRIIKYHENPNEKKENIRIYQKEKFRIGTGKHTIVRISKKKIQKYKKTPPKKKKKKKKKKK